MLKLTVKPGEYLTIGDDIKVIFTGGTERNMYVLVDAPKEYKILRNKLIEKEQLKNNEEVKTYYKDSGLSEEARERIKDIILEDRKNWEERKNRKTKDKEEQ